MNSEIQEYSDLLNILISKTRKHVEGATTEALNWRPPAEGANSVAVISVHMCGVVRGWTLKGMTGDKRERDRPSEFLAVADDEGYVEFWGRRVRLLSLIDDTLADVNRVLGGMSLEDLDETFVAHNGETTNRRYAIVHTIDELAQHVGHLELTLQMWASRQA